MAEEGNRDKSDEKLTPQKLDVKFDANGQEVQVNLGDVGRFFTDLDKYNQQYSLGSMMARMMISRFEPEEGKTPTSKTGLADEENKQQTDAFFFGAAHKKTLDNIGLSMEPVAGATATIMGKGEQAQDSQMRVNIGNRNRFTSFLSALEPDQINEADLKSKFENLPQILSRQVLEHYNFNSNVASDEILELFGGLEKIISEYKRLGMGKSVEKLETYLKHGRKGDLREFVSIERRGLLSEPEKFFGPADWQTDSAPIHLESRWSEAIGILRMARDNPKASDLYQQLSEHLAMCADLATKSARTLGYLSDEVREEHLKILRDAKQKIIDLTREAPKLD